MKDDFLSGVVVTQKVRFSLCASGECGREDGNNEGGILSLLLFKQQQRHVFIHTWFVNTCGRKGVLICVIYKYFFLRPLS